MLSSYAPCSRPSEHTAVVGAAALAQRRLSMEETVASAPRLWTLDELVAEETRAADGFDVPSFSQSLDSLIGGGSHAGLRSGTVTEFCGAPGTGKTQLAMQFAVAANLPQEFGGPGGSCILVDTEGSFVAGRFREIAAAAAAHVQLVANHQGHSDDADGIRAAASRYTVDAIMENTFVERVTSLAGLAAFVTVLPSVLAIRADARVVIIDSIAFPFRAAEDVTASDSATTASSSSSSWDAIARRTRLAVGIARELHRVSREHNVAVIVTNQLVGGRQSTVDGGAPKVVPALGDGWHHAIGNRFCISAPLAACGVDEVQRGVRQVTVLKSSRCDAGGRAGDSCFIQIQAAGVRDSITTAAVA